MQRLIIFTAKALEKFLYGLERVLSVGIFILAIGCITTYLYHTTYHQIWLAVITVLACGAIGGALLNVVEFALVESIHPENMATAFFYGQIERWKTKLEKEGKILRCMAFATVIIGRFMIGGYPQAFTGDPWWVTVDYAPFATMIPFGFYQGLQSMICSSILKARKK